MVAIQVSEDLMRVRSFLAVRVGSGPVADALEVVGHIADRAVGVDPKYLKIAAGVAGREQILPRGLHAEVRRILAVRRHRVEKRERPVRLVYHIGAHAPFGHLVDGVQVPQPRVESKVGWVRSYDEGLEVHWRQPAIARLHPEY